MSGKDLSREEFQGLTMWGDAIGAQVRDRGQVALHVRDDAPRSSENFHPVLLEARDVARLRALLNEAERRSELEQENAELRKRIEKIRQRLLLGERRAQGFYEDGSDSLREFWRGNAAAYEVMLANIEVLSPKQEEEEG